MPFEDKHRKVLQAFADRFGVPSQGDEQARDWTFRLAEQFVFSFPSEGWGTKRASPTRPQSTDVICRIEGNRLIGYDVVLGAGAPGAQLLLNPLVEDISDQVFIAVKAVNHIQAGSGGGGTTKHACQLGVSFFPALRLLRRDPNRYRQQLAWFKDSLRPDYARIFWYLGGEPWAVIGTADLSDNARIEALQEVCEDLLSIKVKPQVTVFGTEEHDEGRARDLVNQFAHAFRPYASKSFLVDAVNEPGPVGFRYSEVRAIGRWLVDAALNVPLLSLASPDATHAGVGGRVATDAELAADTQHLYGGMPVVINCITPHWGRDPWDPHRNLGPAAVGRKIVNDEPRGYRSSVASIEDPRDFARDYLSSARAGEVGYTFHTEPGVWMGHCNTATKPHWAENNRYKRIQDLPNIDAIVEALHKVRESGEMPGGEPHRPPPPPPPPDPDKSVLMPDKSLRPDQWMVSPGKDYHAVYQQDGNFVIYHRHRGPIWNTGVFHTPGFLIMQLDGNLVIYDANNVPQWASGTDGHENAMVQLQDDGNLVIYKDGQPLWASGGEEKPPCQP